MESKYMEYFRAVHLCDTVHGGRPSPWRPAGPVQAQDDTDHNTSLPLREDTTAGCATGTGLCHWSFFSSFQH